MTEAEALRLAAGAMLLPADLKGDPLPLNLTRGAEQIARQATGGRLRARTVLNPKRLPNPMEAAGRWVVPQACLLTELSE